MRPGLKLGTTHDFDDKALLYMEPVLEVWRKQGYVRFPDGSGTIRIWLPGPLDVCFCGGPKRFAECYQE
jgi:hypothetical protein